MSNLIKYKDEEKTVQEWADIFGLSMTDLYDKLRKSGGSLEKALSMKGNRRIRMITYEGKTKSLKEWSTELRIPYYTLRSRLNELNWTVKRAFETPYKESRKVRKDD
jgi:hypothetical protein